MHQTVLIEDLAVILCIAAIVTVLFQKIKQPVVLGYLIAGFIVGPYSPPFSLVEDVEYIKILAEMGVIFLLFSLGLEFTYRKLINVGISSIFIAVFEVIAMIGIGFLMGRLYGLSSYDSLLLGGALSISSTTVIIKTLEELKLKKQFFSQLMVGVLLVEDILAILLLVYVATTISTETIFSYKIVVAAANLILVIAAWFLLGYLVIPLLMRRIEKYINAETLTIISTGLCLFLSTLAVFFHYSAALGAFIMGCILAESPQIHKIEKLIIPIRDMFAAIFFVSVGMLINPATIWEFLPYILLLSLVTILGKITISTLGAIISGQSVSTALKIGFGMAQIGEFSFIIVGFGGALMSDVSDSTHILYSIVVAISVITTFATPYLMRFSVKFSESAEKNMPAKLAKFLEKYDDKLKSIQETTAGYFGEGQDLLRFFINAVVVAIIFSIFRKLLSMFPDSELWIQGLILVGAFICASPFIWAMIYRHDDQQRLHLSFSRVIFWMITVVEVVLLSLATGAHPILILPVVILTLLFFLYFGTEVRAAYLWLENQLVNNLAHTEENQVPSELQDH